MKKIEGKMRILDKSFFCAPADKLATALLGKVLVRKTQNSIERYYIAETECYMGREDTACHASRKNPLAAQPLWLGGGRLYVRLIYGLHIMLNIVAGREGDPMGVLVRGVVTTDGRRICGPARVTKLLGITREFNREDLLLSDRIWIENGNVFPQFTTAPRVGVDYAQKCDRDRLWRFLAYDFL